MIFATLTSFSRAHLDVPQQMVNQTQAHVRGVQPQLQQHGLDVVDIEVGPGGEQQGRTGHQQRLYGRRRRGHQVMDRVTLGQTVVEQAQPAHTG